MPNFEEFINKLEKAGIDSTTMVIAYDQGEGALQQGFGGYYNTLDMKRCLFWMVA